MANSRTYILPLDRWRAPGTYPAIIEEMKAKGFVFDSDDGKYPLKLKQPFKLIPPTDPRGGVLQYVQWDEETSE